MVDFLKSVFARKKMEPWEKTLMLNTINLLPAEYHYLGKQIEAGIFNGRVHIDFWNNDNTLGYVSFSFNPPVRKKFEKRKEQAFKLTGIKVYDSLSKTDFQYTITVSSGTAIGYSMTWAKKFLIDVNNIDVSEFKKEYFVNPAYKKIEKLLSATEKKAINQSEVYEVALDGKVYFHLKDLEDGDFIGIDDEKNIYEITHDPYEKKLLTCGLVEALK